MARGARCTCRPTRGAAACRRGGGRAARRRTRTQSRPRAPVMKGYWNLPDATAAAISPDGWFASGDIGRVDDDGYFYIVDRKKELIIRGGFNVYPREIEEVLY